MTYIEIKFFFLLEVGEVDKYGLNHRDNIICFSCNVLLPLDTIYSNH